MSSKLKFEPIPFSIWYDLNQEDIEREFTESGKVTKEFTSCGDCDGDGYRECDMGYEHDCEECDGTGKLVLELPDVIRNYAWDVYNFRVAKDNEKLIVFGQDKEAIVTIDEESPCLSVTY